MDVPLRRAVDARAALALCCLAAVVTAGCLGGVLSDGPTTAPPSTADPAAAEVTSTDAGDPTDGTDDAHGRPYPETLPDGGAVLEGHIAALEAAERFTVVSNVTVRAEETTLVQRRTTAVDLATGRYNRTTRAAGGGRTDLYGRFGDSTVVRDVLVAGKERFFEHGGLDRRAVLADGVTADAFGDFEYAYEGTVAVDGERLHRYRADGPEQLRGTAVLGDLPAENVSAFARDVYVTAAGRLVRVETRMNYSHGGERSLRSTVRFEAVGATTVREPDWYDEGVRTVESRPRPDDVVTRTERHGAATLEVTGERWAVEGSRSALRLDEGRSRLYNDATNRSRVGAFHEVVVRLDDDEYETATLRVGYDESSVPDGDETGLVLVRYDRDLQTFVRVEAARHDEDANAFVVDDVGTGTYAAFHWETWVAAFGE